MMPYEFNAIDRDGMKRWLRQNVQNNYLCLALEKIVDEMDCKIARVSIKGEWEVNGINKSDGTAGNFRCSVCGGVSLKDSCFCPNCGAKMDGDKE